MALLLNILKARKFQPIFFAHLQCNFYHRRSIFGLGKPKGTFVLSATPTKATLYSIKYGKMTLPIHTLLDKTRQIDHANAHFTR